MANVSCREKGKAKDKHPEQSVIFSEINDCLPLPAELPGRAAQLADKVTHVQWASHQVYASLTPPVQLCARVSINEIPYHDRHVHMYVRTS